jgi:polar amino acid transport system substrate-binding protein
MQWYRAVLAGFLALVATSSAYAEAKTVTLATSVWPPYVMDDKSPHHGYAYDVVKQAFEAAGYKVTIKVMQWEKARELAIAGKVDGLFPEYDSSSNLDYFVYSNPFLTGPLVLYTKKDTSLSVPTVNNQVEFFKQMKDDRFGVVEGYTNVPAFDNNHQLMKKEVEDDKANLEQLYHGDVDFILIDGLNAHYLLSHELPKEYSEELKPVGPVLAKVCFYIVFSKKASHVEQLNEDFDIGLKKIQEAHKTNAIMQEYISEFIDKENVHK